MHSCKLKIGCLFEVEHIFRENDSYIILRIPILYKISTEIYSEMFLKHHYDSQCCHIFEIIEILFEKQKFWILWFSIPYPYKFIDNSSSCPNHTDRNPLKHVSKGRNMSPPFNKNKKKKIDKCSKTQVLTSDSSIVRQMRRNRPGKDRKSIQPPPSAKISTKLMTPVITRSAAGSTVCGADWRRTYNTVPDVLCHTPE